MEKVAKFEKVSFDQFKIDCIDKLGNVQDMNGVYNDIIFPKRATVGSAGYDFFAPVDITLAPNETITVPTGIRAKINEGYVLLIFPRSGLGFKYRLQLDNTIGVIDADYYGAKNEGHIMIKITNDTKENRTLTIPKGTGFAQGIFMSFGITIDDNTSNIREGGMGSTTK